MVELTIDRSLEGVRSNAAGEVRSLVEAALVLIRREGEVEPKVSAIVKEAGLHNQAFYRHFRSKRELLMAVLDEGVRILASYVEHRMASAGGPADQIRAWIRGVLEQALSDTGAAATRPFVLARGRLTESFPAEVSRSERQLTALLLPALQAAVANGELPRVVPERDAEALHLLAMGWVQAQLLSPGTASREAAAHLEAFAMAGLARADGSDPK